MSDSVDLSDQGRQGPTPRRDRYLLRCYRLLEIDLRIEKLRNEEIRRLCLDEGRHLAMPVAEAGSQSPAQLPWLLNEVREVGNQGRHGLGDTIDAGPSYDSDARDDSESRTATAITPARQQPQRGREPAPAQGRFHPYRGMASRVTSRPRIPSQSSQTRREPRSDPPSSTGANVAPAPAPQAALSPLFVGSHRFCNPVAVRTFFCKKGLNVPPSIPRGYTLASVTPEVTSKSFTALFGGRPIHERPLARSKKEGKKEILCLNRKAQPYAPTSPGEAGLLLVIPNTFLLEDDFGAFHVFMNMSLAHTADGEKYFRYFGTYTKVPTTRTTLGVDEWRSLSIQCRDTWSERIAASKVHEARAILARASLRHERPNGPPPSLDEVDEWLENNLNPRKGDSEKSPSCKIRAALDSGKERMAFEVVKCVRYDLEIVKKLQTELALH
ncbi:hypothetical protein BC827DRAFT_1159281 [Russula dissimulans]|nr:hypothetical protein BC827DRAFT_1159281 [Russula dissimulans]